MGATRACQRGAALRESDERFWRENKRFFTERMGQPCCTLAGVSRILAHMGGDFAVVVHGERDCVNNFPHFEGPSVSRFYCTGITQAEFASGRTAAPLRRCLETVIAETSPEAVFVLGTCLMEMISADMEKTCAAVSQRSGVPVAALRTSGLKVASQAEYTDRFYSVLASLPPKRRHRRAGVNIVGLPRLAPARMEELRDTLKKGGARLGCSYPLDASLDDWRGLRSGAVNLVVDRSLYPRFIERLEGLGSPVAEVPLPVGLDQSAAFFLAAALRGGDRKAMDRAVARPAAAARKRVNAFRRRHGRLRVAVGLRMSNFSTAAQMALDGLGELGALSELRWRLTLLIQGPPDPAGRRYFSQRLRELGVGLPYRVFAEPGELPRFLGGGKFDAAYMGDHAREYAREAGIPLIRNRPLEPFFGGVADNLDYFESCLKRRSAP